MNENGQKMRYEMEKMFDIARRLARWKSNKQDKAKTSSLPVGMKLQKSNDPKHYTLDERWNKS